MEIANLICALGFLINPIFACHASTPLMEGTVFCYQNCSDLLWKKSCSSDWEKLLKFEAEGRDFAKFLRSQIGKNYWDLENAGKVRKYPFFPLTENG